MMTGKQGYFFAGAGQDEAIGRLKSWASSRANYRYPWEYRQSGTSKHIAPLDTILLRSSNAAAGRPYVGPRQSQRLQCNQGTDITCCYMQLLVVIFYI